MAVACLSPQLQTRLRTSHDVNLLVFIVFREEVNRVLERHGVEHDGRDIPEQDALLGKVCVMNILNRTKRSHSGTRRIPQLHQQQLHKHENSVFIPGMPRIESRISCFFSSVVTIFNNLCRAVAALNCAGLKWLVTVASCRV